MDKTQTQELGLEYQTFGRVFLEAKEESKSTHIKKNSQCFSSIQN